MKNKSFSSDDSVGEPAEHEPQERTGWRAKVVKINKPEKVDPARLEAKFDGWTSKAKQRAERLADRTPEQKASASRRLVCIALGVALIGAGVWVSVGNTLYTNTEREQTAEIRELTVELEEAKEAQAEAPEVTSESLTELNIAATDAAKDVADAQNEFARLRFEDNEAALDPSGNGAPSEVSMKIAEHRRTLEPYFTKSALVVESDDEAYSFTTAPLYEVDQIDPRFEWYIRYDGFEATDPDGYSWKVEVAMPDIDDPTTANVVWVCADSEGRTLAWAQSTFDGETEKFGPLTLSTTAEGLAHAQDVGIESPEFTVPELGEQ